VVNPKANQERNAIVAEMNAIIRELESVSSELSGQRGIGAERCRNSLHGVANKYRKLKGKLDGMP
jgi:hypothetical protein